MRKTIGLAGIVGLVLVVAGLAIVAVESLIVAGGLLIVLLGLGAVAYGTVSQFMQAMGLTV